MRTVVGILVLSLIAVGYVPARAQDDLEYGDDPGYGYEADAPDEAPDEQSLAPYGQWLQDPGYGDVWRPAVAYGWRPYVDGYWAWTSYGWTWVSSEPWAWTFHYGRWANLPTSGWVWVPGTGWGPAWVSWFWGDGFVGWAPLAPFATQVTVIERFVFVHDRDLCSRGLGRLAVDRHLLPDHVIRRWQRGDGFRPPGRHRIETVSGHPITPIQGRPPSTVAPTRLRSGPRLARPPVLAGLGGARGLEPRSLGRPLGPVGTPGARAPRAPRQDQAHGFIRPAPGWRAPRAVAGQSGGGGLRVFHHRDRTMGGGLPFPTRLPAAPVARPSMGRAGASRGGRLGRPVVGHSLRAGRHTALQR